MISKDMININLIKSLLLSRKYHARFILHSKMHTYIDTSADIKLGGTLDLGKRWGSTGYKDTSLSVEKNSSFVTHGYMDVVTGAYIRVAENAVFDFGSGSINQNSNIQCYQSITIGKNVAISENVTIRDTDNHFIIANGEKSKNTEPIVIGDHVWIGMNVTILKGVHIGNHSIIGAGSIVTHDIPDNCLAVGTPARVIRKNVDWTWA